MAGPGWHRAPAGSVCAFRRRLSRSSETFFRLFPGGKLVIWLEILVSAVADGFL